MAKVALALALVLMSLVTLTVVAIYYFSINQPNQKEQAAPTVSPTPTSSPEPTASLRPTASPVPTPSPTPKPYPKPDPTVVITPWYWNQSLYSSNDSSIVIIASPENDKTYNTSSVTLSVNVGTRLSFIHSVSYKADWPGSGNNIFFHLGNYGGNLYLFPTQMSITLKPTGIPEGNHNITVYATIISALKDEHGRSISYTFSESVNFTIAAID